MFEATILEPVDRAGIGLMLVGPKDRGSSFRDDSGEKFDHLLLRGLGIGTTMLLFENLPFQLLCWPHRATSPKLGVVEAIDVMGRSDDQIQVHRPVLAVFEASQAVEDERLDR